MGKQLSIILICFVALGGCITTGQDRVAILEQHIYEAEKKIETLEAGAAKGQDQEGLQDRFAETRVRLDELSERVQELNGKIEELNFSIDEKLANQDSRREKNEEMLAAAEQRIAKLEEYLNLESTHGVHPPPTVQTNTPPNTAPPANVPEESSPEKLYTQAKETFDKGNLEAARVQFEKLLERYPKSANADNAQFWIAEAYYKEKWYEKAVLEYQKVIEKYPGGNKIQAALLKQGFSFLNMGDKTNAKIILNQLVTKYPKSPEAEAARAKLKTI